MYLVGDGEIKWFRHGAPAPYDGGWLRAGAVEYGRKIYVAGGWAYTTSAAGKYL